MRVLFVSLLLVAAACTTPAESADTTTTTTTPATSTTGEPTTTTTTVATPTTTEPECVERDGVLYDSRGFVCPPSMPFAQVELLPPTWYHRPGTYTMRVFEPGFSFTRDAVFQSYGENALLVSLDDRPTCSAAECFQTVSVLSAGFVSQLEPVLTGDTEWVVDLTITPIDFEGLSATQIDFTVDTCDSAGGIPCSVPIRGLSSWVYLEETQNRLLVIDTPGGPIGYDIGAHQSRFDTYWTEVAEPILASIKFTDG